MNNLKWILLACCLWVPGMSIASAPIRLLTEDYPPYDMMGPDGQITGVSTEIVKEMFRRASIPYTMEMHPWSQAFNETVQNDNTCVFSTTRTASRELQFKWVGPLLENTWALYAGPASPRKRLVSIEQVRNATIGGYSGDAEAQYLMDQGFNVQLAPLDSLNPQKLEDGLIDYWATSVYRVNYLIKNTAAAKLQKVLDFNTVELYLACNPGVSNETTSRLNEALGTMLRDRYTEQMRIRYMEH